MKKVLVFLGGASREHDISVLTGRAVIRNLPLAGYVPVPAFIGRDGRMCFPPADDPVAEAGWLQLPEALATIRETGADCAFIALHGTWGEDGRIQSLCDLMGLPYVGSDSVGSAVGIDKWATKAVYLASGVPTPPAVMLRAGQLDDNEELSKAVEKTGFPMVIKAAREGSSFGVAIVRNRSDFPDALKDVRACSDVVLFEQYKKGREFSVPVVEDPETGSPRHLPVIEIVVHASTFFDYGSKYDPTAADEICPAPVDSDLADRLGSAAVLAHNALMLKGYSRTDFIVTDDGGIWALETNTLPGLTEYSLLPKSAAVAKISYPELLDLLIRGCLRRRQS